MPRHLVTGGARSGKSAFAEALARASGLPTSYIATAAPGDAEMRERIARHRARRPAAWHTVECGSDLAGALAREARAGRCVIVDCLTLWLAGLIDDDRLSRVEAGRKELLGALAAAGGTVLVVTNELGSGVVPAGRLSREFVDEHGLTNQRVAALCEDVTLMVSGCTLPLRRGGANPSS